MKSSAIWLPTGQNLAQSHLNALPDPADEVPRLYSLSDLLIRTKDKRLIPLEPNAVQCQYLDQLCPTWRKGGQIQLQGQREIILKSRQFGFSTLILALLFLDTINTPHTQTVVVAHDMDSTIRLFQMVQRFYAHLPQPKPRAQYANRREFYWPLLDSSFFVGTAGNGEFGRGSTISNVHASEIGFWPDGEEIMASLLQAVPPHGNVFQESTANGVGNYFFTEYERARTQESTFTARFFPWFAHPEYSARIPEEEKRKKGEEEVCRDTASHAPTNPLALDDDEQQLCTLYNLSDEQLLWRRLKMREPGLRHKFVQEFPSNDREAFLSSGTPYFDLEKLDALARQLQDECFDPLPIEVPTRFPNLRRHRAALQLWAVPKTGHAYVIGADTAEGISSFGDHDFDSASVWDASSGEQVAHLHGHFDTHLYGLLLAELGFWFNTALLGIERNNHGHAVINSVLHSAHYPESSSSALLGNEGPGVVSTGLYLHQEYDEKRQPRERRPGFPTTSASKYLILDELASAIENDEFHPRSRALVADLMRFVHLPGGKAGGEAGVHDDRVMDAAIARRMLNLRPRPVAPFFFNVQ